MKKIIPILVLLISFSSVLAWGDSNFDKCKNITMTESGLVERTFEPVEVSGVTEPLRVYDDSCDGTGTEIPYQILDSGNVLIEANVTLSGNSVYSVYYENNTEISDPSYSSNTLALTKDGSNYMYVFGKSDSYASDVFQNQIDWNFTVGAGGGIPRIADEYVYLDGSLASSDESGKYMLGYGAPLAIYINDIDLDESGGILNYDLVSFKNTTPIMKSFTTQNQNLSWMEFIGEEPWFIYPIANISQTVTWELYDNNGYYKKSYNLTNNDNASYDTVYQILSFFNNGNNNFEYYSFRNSTGWYNNTPYNNFDTMGGNLTMVYDTGDGMSACVVWQTTHLPSSTKYLGTNWWDNSGGITGNLNWGDENQPVLNESDSVVYTYYAYLYEESDQDSAYNRCDDFEKQIVNPLGVALGDEQLNEGETTTTTVPAETTTTTTPVETTTTLPETTTTTLPETTTTIPVTTTTLPEGLITKTLREIGEGTGSLFEGMGAPLTVFLILLSLGVAVGYILTGIGKGVGGKI
jgi:hypothetical protein